MWLLDTDGRFREQATTEQNVSKANPLGQPGSQHSAHYQRKLLKDESSRNRTDELTAPMNEDDVTRLISEAEEEVDQLILQNPVIVFSDSTDGICSKAKQVSVATEHVLVSSLVVGGLLCG